jgi:peptide deformylase
MAFFEPPIAEEVDAVAACIRQHWVDGANAILFTHCGAASLEW